MSINIKEINIEIKTIIKLKISKVKFNSISTGIIKYVLILFLSLNENEKFNAGFLFLKENFLEANIGIKKSDTNNEANRENTTASERSPNICPAIPSTKTIGKKTAIVVIVEATTAPPTSDTPLMAEFTQSSPSSLHLKILSMTTMELSTSIPIPRARPPRDIMFKLTWKIFRGAKAAINESGIEIATITVVEKCCKNKNRMITARTPPKIAVFFTSLIEFSINIAWSARILNCKVLGNL